MADGINRPDYIRFPDGIPESMPDMHGNETILSYFSRLRPGDGPVVTRTLSPLPFVEGEWISGNVEVP